MEANLKTLCPQCRRMLKVDARHVGRTVRCPGCRHSFSVTSVQFAEPHAKTPSLDATETRGIKDVSLESVGNTVEPSVGKNKIASGVTFGRFRLHELLGQGAFGRVDRAYDPLLDRFVALKRPRFVIREPDKVQRFLGEAQAAARLRHPHIVAVYESGETDGHHFIAAELVDGETLAHRLERSRPEIRDAVEWVRLLAEALAYAHASGIVHRDIKSQNIMLDTRGRPQILDFGLAKRLDDDSSRTVAGSIVGTPAYMSPEQARGDLAAVGAHSDQYSLGVVLYELLTGSRPFTGSAQVVVSKVVSDEPPRPRSLCSEIPIDLEAICLKAMEKERARRYATCQELADDLGRWLRDEPVRARPLTARHRLLRWRRRQPLFAGLMLCVSLLLVAAAGGGVLSAALVSRSRNELARTLANAKEQTRKATEQTERARSNTEAAHVKTHLASVAAQQAVAQRLTTEAALRDLEQAIAQRITAGRELQTTVAAKAGAEQSAKNSMAKTMSVKAETSSFQKLAADNEFQTYIEWLTEAQRCLEQDDAPAAIVALAKCPESQRGWEWQFLNKFATAKDPAQHMWLLDFSHIASLQDAPPVAISPDGKRLAVIQQGSRAVWNSSCTPEVWNIEQPDRPKRVAVIKSDLPLVHYRNGRRDTFLFSRDGQWLAHPAYLVTGSLMDRIRITSDRERWIGTAKSNLTLNLGRDTWDDSVLVKAANQLTVPNEQFVSRKELRVSPDGRLDVSLLENRPIEVTHLASKRVLVSLKFPRTVVAKLSERAEHRDNAVTVWSRDGHRLIVVRHLPDGAGPAGLTTDKGYGVLILSTE